MPKVEERRRATGTRYVVRVRDPNPKPPSKGHTSATFATRPEAQRFVRDCEDRGIAWALAEYHRTKEQADEMTLDEWATRYFDSLTISPVSIDGYRRDWRLRWQPHLGHMRLSQIGREDIVAAIKAQTGIAPKTLANAWGTLATMLRVAVEDEHLARSPAKGVKLPTHATVDDHEHRYLNGEELQQVIADTAEHYRPLVWMLVGTGMRWGEATALTVGDVNLTARTVRVVKAWKRDPENGSYYVGSPKTKKSRRTITLPNEVVEAVRPLTEGRKPGGLLFTNTRGDRVRHDVFYRDHWHRRCVVNVAEPAPRIHDLRHSHAAALIARGIHPAVIQARLGHESVTTTIDTYGHLFPDLQRQAADAADAVFSTEAPKAIARPGHLGDGPD